MNWLALFFGLALAIFILIIQTGTAYAIANSDDNGTGGNSAKTFSIQSSNDYTKKAGLTNTIVNAGQVFPIYIYAINYGNAQAPAVEEPIPVQVTLFDPNNQQTFQTDIIIPVGPANTYGTLNISGSFSGKWTVQVVGNPGKGTVTVRDYFTIKGQQPGLNVTPIESSITLGKTQQFTATYFDDIGTEIDVTQLVNWSSSDSSVAVISPAGLATSSKLGTSTITAEYQLDKKAIYTDTALLKIELPTLEVTSEATMISIGSSQTYQAKLYDSDGNPTDVTVNWSSSSTDVATINSSGLATGQGLGTCTISGTYQISGVNVSATETLMVVNLSITPANKFVSLGTTLQYEAKFTNSTGTVTVVTGSENNRWSIINFGLETPATISPFGLATAKASGSCLIMAKYMIDGVSITTTTPLTIVLPTLSITSSSTTLGVDNTQPYLATLTDCDMNQSNVTSLVTWTSDKPNVATIDASTGIATGAGVGTCTITGTYSINEVNITTEQTLKIVKLSITPTNTTISLGMTLQYKAEFTDSDGTMTDVENLQPQSSSVSWTSDKPSVATIDGLYGLVTSASLGTCTITVTYSIDGASIIATTPLKIVNLNITPASTTISSGMTQQYKAEYTDSDGVTTNITSRATWVSSKVSVATIDASGRATGVGGGTTTITVTDSVTEVSGTEILTVLPTMNIISTTTPILPGDTQQFEAQLVYADGSNTVVTTTANWVSSNVGVAMIGLNTGMATGIGGGTVSITVTDPVTGVSGTDSLTVLPMLRITSSTLSMAPGESIDFSAQLIYADSTEDQDITDRVTWVSSNFGVATFELAGKVTAHGGGVCTITARDTLTGLSETAVLTVTPVLSVSPSSVTIFPEASQQFKAELIYYNGPIPAQVSWSSSVPAVATIDPSGYATGVGGGISTIMATYPTGLSKTVSLTVLPRLSITLTTPNLIPGSSLPLKAELVYVDGTPSQDITTTTATWSSDDETVCTVSTTGNLTALTSGNCTITALDKNIDVSGSVNVTVMAPNQLRITPANLAPLSIGGNVHLTVALVYPDGSTKEIISSVTWASNNINVATVDSTGKLTGLGGGQCLITAIDSDSGLIGTLTVTVLPSVTISPYSRAILIGDNLPYKAELIYSDGTPPKDVTSGVTWNSDNSGVASISPSGIATGIGDGSCTITASFNDSPSNPANLTVAPTSTIKNLIITPVSVTPGPLVDAIFEGDTLQFKAQWLFANDTTSDVLNSVDWKSSIKKVATIDNGGLVTGIAAGTSTISGKIIVDGKRWEGSLLLTVLPPKGGIIRSSEQ